MRSCAHSVAGLRSVSSKKFSDGEWLLARKLNDEKRDSTFAGRDDQAVPGSLDDLTGGSRAIDNGGFVDNQPMWFLG